MSIWKNSIKLYFLFSIVLLLSNCYLKIPITYYPLYAKNFSTPSNIMQYYIKQNVYLNFEIGFPKQKCQIPLVFDTNNFFITNLELFANKTENFAGFSLYNLSKSETHNQLSYYDTLDCDYFTFTSYDGDQFYFNNNNYSMEFFCPYENDMTTPGGIGMLLDPIENHVDNKKRKYSFLGQLKEYGLVEEYHWSIFYDSKEKNKKEENGFMLFGKLPHEIDSNLGYYKKGYFKEKDKKNYYIEPKNLPKLSFDTDFLFAYEGTDKNKIIEDFPFGLTNYKTIQLDYHSGAVQVPKSLQTYYHRVFEKYIINGQCFNETLSRNYDYYYCKNDKNVIKQIKSVFPGINLKSQDLNFNFTLEADDLFIEENNYVFCLIYFYTSQIERMWKMGKPFLKKYQFSLNYDQKIISFYNRIDDEPKQKNGVSIVVFVLVIIATIIIVAVICFIIFKFFLYERFFRKKRVNELDDDDYQYTANKDKEDSLNINN